jgi:rSAM/selenodomain-associated transferase 2
MRRRYPSPLGPTRTPSIDHEPPAHYSAGVRLSVIVPALDEEPTIAATLARIRGGRIHELVVVDGGSRDATRAVAAHHADQVLSAPTGRASQMNAGAAAATGDTLLFVHSDTVLPLGFDDAIARALADHGVVGGRFDVELRGASRMLALVAAAINWRSRWTRLATGDQAIFIRRDVFAAIGGYAPVPLFEDVRLSRAMKRAGRVACLRERVSTSARRWERRGMARTILLMWMLRAAHAAGVSPATLRRLYEDVR